VSAIGSNIEGRENFSPALVLSQLAAGDVLRF